MTRRLYGPVVLGLLVVGALALYAVTRVWLSMTVATPGLPADRVTVTGQDAAPVLVAIAVVVAAGGLAVVASGGWFRQLIGFVVAGLSALAAVTAYRIDVGGRPLEKALHSSVAFMGQRSGELDQAPWRVVVIALFAAATVLGLVVTGVSRGWPSMGRRYDRVATPTDELDLWKAFDEGQDPTGD